MQVTNGLPLYCTPHRMVLVETLLELLCCVLEHDILLLAVLPGGIFNPLTPVSTVTGCDKH